MIDTPEIVTTPARAIAVIPFDIPRSEMGPAFSAGIGELLAELKAQRIAPTGPVFAHHLRIVADRWIFDLGIPTATPVRAAGRVVPREWPAQRVARTICHGDYEGLPGAWGEFAAWMKAQGLTQAEDLWESYTVGPQTSADLTTWRTELVRPLG